MSSSTMSKVINAAISRGHTLPGSIGRFQAIPSVEDDILPNLTFALHPNHGSAPKEYQCLLDGLKHALFMYLLTTRHLDPKWNNAITYLPGVHIMEWTSLCYKMLYTAAFPHRNPRSRSKIHMFLLPSVERKTSVSNLVAEASYLWELTSDQVSGCIINIDYELSEALEAMALMSLQALYAQNFMKLPLIPTPSPPDGLSPNQSLPTQQYHFCITAICLRTLDSHPILKSDTSWHYGHVNTDFDGPPIIYGNAASASKYQPITDTPELR
ncbi:hypothetical protein F5146DRAFT_1130253 [Armillaria mellea]|nr:hypothetical protein F5146DRAFT_1130253 [Armillaria mellea]